MNLGEIRTNIIDSLRESSTPVSVSTEELNRYINDGYREIAIKTMALAETVQLSVLANTPFTDLPSNSLAQIAFVDSVSALPIHPKHWTWVDRRDRNWIRRTRSRPSVVFPFGMKKLGWYPLYESNGTVDMTHVYVPPVDALSDDADVPDLPKQYHMAFVHYGHYRSLLKDVDSGPRLGRALRQRKYYLETIDGITIWSLERHNTISKAVYGVSMYTPTTISEMG